MIEIEAREKDFAKTLNCLSDLVNIKTSHLFPDKLDFTLNKNIYCDKDNYIFIMEDLYFLDKKNSIYALDISNAMGEDEIEKDLEI